MEGQKIFITVENGKARKAKTENEIPIEPSLIFKGTSGLISISDLKLITDGVEDMIRCKEDYKGIFYSVK